MIAYLIIDLAIIDADGFMEYVRRIPDLIEKYSGRYLVQGVEPTIVEGSAENLQRSVVIEFPSRELAESFLDERGKSDLHEIWARTTSSRILLVDGCT
jgi:uncharacterized protein (DUF1330 family)